MSDAPKASGGKGRGKQPAKRPPGMMFEYDAPFDPKAVRGGTGPKPGPCHCPCCGGQETKKADLVLQDCNCNLCKLFPHCENLTCNVDVGVPHISQKHESGVALSLDTYPALTLPNLEWYHHSITEGLNEVYGYQVFSCDPHVDVVTYGYIYDVYDEQGIRARFTVSGGGLRPGRRRAVRPLR